MQYSSILFSLLFVSSTTLNAESFRYEIGGIFSQGDVTGPVSARGVDANALASLNFRGVFGEDFDTNQLQARVYFDDVKTRQYALKEAAFISKSSYVDLAYTDTSFDSEDNRFDSLDAVDSSDFTKISGRYYVSLDSFVLGHIRSNENSDEIRLGYGIDYIYSKSGVKLQKQEYRGEYTKNSDADFESIGFQSHLHTEYHNGSAYTVDFGATYYDLGGQTGFGGNAQWTYYPHRRLDFFVGIDIVDIAFISETELKVGVDYFVTDKVLLQLSLSTTEAEARRDDFEQDLLTLGSKIRF